MISSNNKQKVPILLLFRIAFISSTTSLPLGCASAIMICCHCHKKYITWRQFIREKILASVSFSPANRTATCQYFPVFLISVTRLKDRVIYKLEIICVADLMYHVVQQKLTCKFCIHNVCP